MTGDRQPADREQNVNVLLVIVGLLTLLVVGLGAAVVFIQLNSDPVPQTVAERDLNLWLRLADDNPDAVWAQVGLGQAHLAGQDMEAARAAFAAALAIDPASPEALFQMGLLVRAEDPNLAVDYLRRAVEAATGADKARPNLALGDLLMERGDWEAARLAYESSIANLPFLLPAHLGLARSLEALGDSDGALAAYLQASAFDPTDPEIKEAITRLGGTQPETTNP